MVDLLVAGCTAEAATWAVERWHYSRTLPLNGRTAMTRYGVWEDGRFVGVVVFTLPLAAATHKKFRVSRQEVGELGRVALADDHQAPTSQVVAIAVRMARAHNAGWRVVVSFADPAHGHHGGIYQAMNWTYTGQTADDFQVFWRGRWWSSRVLAETGAGFNSQGRTAPSALSKEQQAQLPRRSIPGKHRYVLPLDRRMRRLVDSMAQPYPAAGR